MTLRFNLRFKASLPSIALTLTVAACSAPQQSGVNTTTDTTNRNAAAQHSPQASGASPGADHANHGSMNHAGMDHVNMQSSPNAASAPYDLQFLDTMVAHHQGAVDMARPAVEKALHTELREFAGKIVEDQEREIAEMKRLREQWYAGKPQAMNMAMAGMTESMRGMDMNKLNLATGDAYDLMFLEQMTPHHEGAVVMSEEALRRAEHAEIKRLARAIIDAQQKEIVQMNNWKDAWRR